jgi:hypothetical protein
MNLLVLAFRYGRITSPLGKLDSILILFPLKLEEILSSSVCILELSSFLFSLELLTFILDHAMV